MSTNDIRWNQNPLINPSNDQLEAHLQEWAFVVLMFTPPKPHFSLEEYLLNQMRWTVKCTSLVESSQTVEFIQQDGLYLTFLFESPSKALSAALTLLQQHQNDFHIGVGLGSGYHFDHFKSLELIRLKGALPYGNTGEIQISSRLKMATEVPHGIGAFQCSPKLAQRIRMNYWILKDYRSSLE